MAEPGKNKVLLFNPRSAERNHRLPLSVMHVAASVMSSHEIAVVDGNLETDSWEKISSYLGTGEYKYFGCTVMPGPQLKQAIPFTRKVKETFPSTITVWGGYFPSLHYEISIRSGYVDYIVRGCGGEAFPALLRHLETDGVISPDEVPNLVYRDRAGQAVTTGLSPLPAAYGKLTSMFGLLHKFYPLEKYIPKTWLGARTISFHTSFGCPHSCSFCGVASVFGGEWTGASPPRIYEELRWLKEQHHVNAVEFLDSNFFASKSRVLELCTLLEGQEISWWAEGRVDALHGFSDEELLRLKRGGCRLVFMGAESGSDAVLATWNKGGSQSVAGTEQLVARFRRAGIIPELSLVLGLPAASPREVRNSIRTDIAFVRKLKRINPSAEFVLYLYSPVPPGIPGEHAFAYPSTLEEWLEPAWEQVDLRRNPPVPWLNPSLVRRVRNFDTVLHAAYPSISNMHIKNIPKYIVMIPGRIRYALRWYRFPLVIKLLQKWIRYQPPEREGFPAE